MAFYATTALLLSLQYGTDYRGLRLTQKPCQNVSSKHALRNVFPSPETQRLALHKSLIGSLVGFVACSRKCSFEISVSKLPAKP